jgi:hypothetical protein
VAAQLAASQEELSSMNERDRNESVKLAFHGCPMFQVKATAIEWNGTLIVVVVVVVIIIIIIIIITIISSGKCT